MILFGRVRLVDAESISPEVLAVSRAPNLGEGGGQVRRDGHRHPLDDNMTPVIAASPDVREGEERGRVVKLKDGEPVVVVVVFAAM